MTTSSLTIGEGDEPPTNACVCGERMEFRTSPFGRLEESCPACAVRGRWRFVAPRRPVPTVRVDTGELAESDAYYQTEVIGGIAFRRIAGARVDTPAIARRLLELVPFALEDAVSARTVTDDAGCPIEVTCHILARFVDAGAMRREKRGSIWHYWRLR